MVAKFLSFFHLLQHYVQGKKGPASLLLVQEYGKNPFLILVSCILSLRTRDTVTIPASRKLFAYAQTPSDILQLETSFLAQLIYPVGFSSKKAITLQKIAGILLEKYKGAVPSSKEELLALPGVGLKTTNLVLSEAFDIPAICVDTHVHRISNETGLVKTSSPEKTEEALQKIVPDSYKRDLARYLVLLGQSPKAEQKEFIMKWNELNKK